MVTPRVKEDTCVHLNARGQANVRAFHASLSHICVRCITRFVRRKIK
jgi:hypothetical protein